MPGLVAEFFGWTSKTVVDEVAEMSNEATAKVVEMSQNVENQLLQLSLDSNRIRVRWLIRTSVRPNGSGTRRSVWRGEGGRHDCRT